MKAVVNTSGGVYYDTSDSGALATSQSSTTCTADIQELGSVENKRKRTHASTTAAAADRAAAEQQQTVDT